MNYYPLHVGDWVLHTNHLTPEEEGVYLRLLNHYYDTEQPIPEKTDLVIRRLRLGSHEKTVALILEEFFTLEADGWHNLRADSEISAYNEKAERARANGKKGGRPKKSSNKNKDLHGEKPKKTQSVISGNPEETQKKANQEPITNNQEPITNINTPQPPKGGELALAKPDLVQTVFNHWITVMGKTAATKLTPARRKKVQARLKEGYTVDQLMTAINGCAKSPFHMGQNDQRTVFDDLELICRSGEKVEGFIQKASIVTPAEEAQKAFDDFLGDSPASNDYVIEGEIL